MNSNPPIGNGQSPNKGDRVKAKHISDLSEKIKRLSRSADVNQNIATKFIEIPFDVSVKIKEGTSNPYQFQISVSRGLVVEKRSSAHDGVDALIYWEASNALTDDEPTWFNIANNQSLFVKVTEVNTGTVRTISSVALEVAASSTISTAYIPAEQDGIYYYEVAAFTIVDGKPVIERGTAGSHIFHEVSITGIYGTYTWTFLDEVTGSESNGMSMEFANGILVASTVTVSGFQTGSGTLADPYFTQFNARDTDT